MTKRTLHRCASLMATVALLAQPVAIFTACQQDDEPEPQHRNVRVPLSLTSGIATAVTRAFDVTWEANDKIGVFTVVAGQTDASKITYSGSYADANIPYQLTLGTNEDGVTYTPASGETSASYSYKGFIPLTGTDSKTIYLPLDGSNVDVYAYYPYDADASAAGKTITLETNQTLAGQKARDLMMAKALTSTNPINIDHSSAPLLFQHCLTKVLIVVKVGTGYNTTDLEGHTSVKIKGTPIQASYAPLTQTLSVTAGNSDIVPCQLVSGDPDYTKRGDGLYIYRALVMPNTVASGSSLTVSGNPAASATRQIEFTISDGATATYSYTIDPTLYPFVAGDEIKFTISLLATGVTITAAITPWSELSTVPDAPLEEVQNS